MHVGQSAIGTVVVIGQARVVDAEQMQGGGMQIVAVGWRFNGFESEFVGGSVADSALDTAAGKPVEQFWMRWPATAEVTGRIDDPFLKCQCQTRCRHRLQSMPESEPTRIDRYQSSAYHLHV